jgi:GTPase SAR1 family protein
MKEDRATYEIHEVFTPTTSAKVTFVERKSVNNKLVDALRLPGKQVVVFGHSGSGKTTLLTKKLEELYEDHVTSRCYKASTFDELMRQAFRKLQTTTAAEKVRTRARKLAASFGMDKNSVGSESSEQSQEKEVPAVPFMATPEALADELGKRRCCWVLEDFHKVVPEEKQKLAQCMKMFKDFADEYPELKIVAIGAVDTAREVIEYDSEMTNRVAEVQVPLMDEDELRQIVQLGEVALNIELDRRVRESIVILSNGLGAACHGLALNILLESGIQRTQHAKMHINTDNLHSGISRFLEESSDTLKKRFDTAFSHIKGKRYDNGRLILEALCKFDQEGAMFGDLLERIREVEPTYPAGNLSTYAKLLCKEDKGELLRFDAASQKYSFRDPLCRVFARSVVEVQKKEGVPGLHQLDDRTINKIIEALAARMTRAVLEGNGGTRHLGEAKN